MSSRLTRLVRLIESLSTLTGRAVAWLTLAMVLVTVVIVLLRYLFNTGWIWLQESVTWMHAVTFMIATAYTLKADDHVRVDIFYRRMTPRRRHLVDLLGSVLLLLPVCGFLLYYSLDYVADSWAVLETSREAGGLPGLFLLKTVIPVTAVLLALQGVTITVKSGLALKSDSSKGHSYDTQVKF